jgi:hypothetical protein
VTIADVPGTKPRPSRLPSQGAPGRRPGTFCSTRVVDIEARWTNFDDIELASTLDASLHRLGQLGCDRMPPWLASRRPPPRADGHLRARRVLPGRETHRPTGAHSEVVSQPDNPLGLRDARELHRSPSRSDRAVPIRSTTVAAWTLPATPRLRSMALTCTLAVFGFMSRRRPISALMAPGPTRCVLDSRCRNGPKGLCGVEDRHQRLISISREGAVNRG